MINFEDDDDDEASLGGLYEDGHWIWDNNLGSLAFVSDLPPVTVETMVIPTKAPTGAVEFRDDIDLLEQMRYRRRYYRKLKPGQADVITLQDVKDLAIFTAPTSILSPTLINILHTATSDRFLRTLIFYSQYYLQIADEMATRMAELDHQIRTHECDLIENVYRANLSDLRALVAKEYSTILLGGADARKYHHMGPQKKKLELNRVFKSDIFNNVEHIMLKTGYLAKKTPEERFVLQGHCLKHDKKLTTNSPLLNEVFCAREIDYRMFSLGVMKVPQLSYRLQYILETIAGPVEKFESHGITLGILGIPRARFDTMLHLIPLVQKDKSKSRASVVSMTSSKSTKSMGPVKMFPDIHLPDAHDMGPIPETFPLESLTPEPSCDVQRRRWLKRLQRLMNPPQSRLRSRIF